MKCNQSRPGFELVSPCSFPTTVTITPRAPPNTLQNQKSEILSKCRHENKHLLSMKYLYCIIFHSILQYPYPHIAAVCMFELVVLLLLGHIWGPIGVHHLWARPGRAKAGQPARTYIQQLCEDTGCSPEDLPEAMNDREKRREKVRDIRAGGTTWWWWWWWWWWYYNITCLISSKLFWSTILLHAQKSKLWFLCNAMMINCSLVKITTHTHTQIIKWI